MKSKTWVRRYGLIFAATLMIAVIVLAIEMRRPEAVSDDTVVVYKTATCNCCSKWVDHLRQDGFSVQVHNESSLKPIKRKLGVPEVLSSCHTATLGNYVIEGHVPASDIRRLLAERPAGRGLAVPGMPLGSPGMEQGSRVEPYKTLLFDEQGHTSTFSEHGAMQAAPTTLSPAS